MITKKFLLAGVLCLACNIYAYGQETAREATDVTETRSIPETDEAAKPDRTAVTNRQTDNYGATAIVKTLRGGEISVHFGGALPMGDFKEYGGIPFGKFGAGTGFAIGIKDIFTTNANGVGMFASADFIYNGLTGKMKEDHDNIEKNGVDVTRPMYINIPILLGVNYRSNGFWIEGGVGPDVRIITKQTQSGIFYDSSGEANYSYFSKRAYKPKVAFAFQVGAGIMLSPRYSLGFNYYGLEGAKVAYDDLDETRQSDGTVTSETSSYATTQKFSQNVFLVRLGYHF